jgi:hypothetical protein
MVLHGIRALAEGVLRIAHWKWWDHHPEAASAFPPEKFCPGFK